MAPPPSFDESVIESARQAFERAIDLLDKADKECAAQYARLADAARHSRLAGLIGLDEAAFRRSMDALKDALDRGLAIAENVLRYATPVLSLFLASVDYLVTVRAPVSEMPAELGVSWNPNFAYWTGEAADQYKLRHDIQVAALQKVAANAVAVSQWLYKIGQYNVEYAVRVMQSLAEASTMMIQVVVETIGTVTLPDAIASLAKTINALMDVCIKELIGLPAKFATVVGDVRDLLEVQSDHGPFGYHGTWPQAVS